MPQDPSQLDPSFDYAKLPDGSYAKFKKGTSQQEMQMRLTGAGLLKPQGAPKPAVPKAPPGAPQQTISAQPSLFSKAGLKEKGWQAVDWATRALPAVGGAVGGVVGAGGLGAVSGGTASGPGALIGASIGGAAGKEAEQGARWMIFGEPPPSSVKKELKTVGLAAAEQGFAEGTGQLGGWLGRVLAPADRTAMLSYATTGGEFSNELKTAMPDLDKAAQALPAGSKVTTVREWQPLLQTAIDKNTAEFEAALAPSANQQIVPVRVANAIKAKLKPATTAEDVAYNNVLKNRALEYETTNMPNRQPWTIENLNKKRIDLQANPAEYQAGNLIQKAKGNANKAADQAAEEEIKSMLYPLADQNMGKPMGYFADVQKRTSAMLKLKKATQEQITKLETAATRTAGAPLSKKINVRIRSWGGAPRPAAGIALGADDLVEANQAVARGMSQEKAFGVPVSQIRAGARKAAPLAGRGVGSLPVRAIFMSMDKPKKQKQQANQPQTGGPQ